MKLLEHQGKELFRKYGIAVPNAVLLDASAEDIPLQFPVVLKSQVPSGDRKKKGGILFADRKEDISGKLGELFQKPIDGVVPEKVLVEEKVDPQKELYVSFSYDTDSRSPVLALSLKGGTGIETANVFPINLAEGLRTDTFDIDSGLKEVIQKLWDVFQKEQALLVEINPLFQLKDGTYVAGDAKVVLDDNIVNPQFRPYVDLEGDIAILASGGGASLLNLDIIMKEGGKPANYVEYSGNPPAAVVEELIQRVLAKPNLKGCWVIGGTANFTDIYETLLGFVQGLRKITPKPTYPIVIRRDGPRREEAFAMLKEAGKKEGYDFHVFGPETSMAESAKIMVDFAYGNSR